MSRKLRITLLGSGCSTGVPRVDGYWGACDPENPKNRRSRCSAWLAGWDQATPEKVTSVMIDTAPECREQILRAGVPHVDAVLWTHDHADQAHGIDDLRAFIFARNAPIDGYMDEATHKTLMSRFGYAFRGNLGYPPVYTDHLIPAHGTAWSVSGEGAPCRSLPLTRLTDLFVASVIALGISPTAATSRICRRTASPHWMA